jgi:hypothetical protein
VHTNILCILPDRMKRTVRVTTKIRMRSQLHVINILKVVPSIRLESVTENVQLPVVELPLYNKITVELDARLKAIISRLLTRFGYSFLLKY